MLAPSARLCFIPWSELRAAFLGSGVLLCELSYWRGSLLKNIAFPCGSGFVVRIPRLRASAANLLLANAHIEQATLRVDTVQQMLALD